MLFIDGSSEALRMYASGLISEVDKLRSVTAMLSETRGTSLGVEAPDWVSSYRAWLERSIARVNTAIGAFSAAADEYDELARSLDQANLQADSAFARHGYPQEGTWARFQFEIELAQIRSDLAEKRSRAERFLKELAKQSPEYLETDFWAILKDQVSGHIRQLPSDLATHVKGTAEGLISTGRFIAWDGTLRIVVDPEGWAKSWQGTIETGKQVLTHPGETASALLSLDLLDRNPFAWGVVMLGDVALTVATFGAGTATKVGQAAAATSRAEKLVYRLEKVEIDPLAKGTAWERYEARGGTLGEAEWSTLYDQALTNRTIGEAYRDMQFERFQTSDLTLTTEVAPEILGGARRLDFANEDAMIGFETKSGRAIDGADALRQLDYDEILLDMGWEIQWISQEAPTSPRVIEKLQQLSMEHDSFTFTIGGP